MTVSEAIPETVADLLGRLGGIPAERVRWSPIPGTATEQDVIDALEGPEKRLCELIDGVLVEKAVGSPESFLGGRLFRKVADHAEENDLGVVLPGDGPLELRAGNVRYPDVSFIPWDSFPNRMPPKDEKIWTVTPALAAEVLSASNTPAEMDRKLEDLFSTGCKLVWLIDPVSSTARIYTTPKRFKRIAITGVLDGGKVLPGFTLPLAKLLAPNEPRNK